MAQIEQIKSEIEKLTENEFIKLRKWFMEKEWKKWDKQIAKDSREGKLDVLIREARKEKEEGKLKAI